MCLQIAEENIILSESILAEKKKRCLRCVNRNPRG